MKPATLITYCLCLTVFVLRGLWPSSPTPEDTFASLPVQHEGRIKPLSTVAQSTLLVLSNKQTVRMPNGMRYSPAEWISFVAFDLDHADTCPVFRVDHPDLLSLCGQPGAKTHTFAFAELVPYLQTLHQQKQSLPTETSRYTAYDQQLAKLCNGLTLYHQLVHSFYPLAQGPSLEMDYAAWLSLREPGMQAIRAHQLKEPYDAQVLDQFLVACDTYLELAKTAALGLFPSSNNTWSNIGQAYLDCLIAQPNTLLLPYLELKGLYQASNLDAFNANVNVIQLATDSMPLQVERIWNKIELFYQATLLYLFVFLITLTLWLTRYQPLEKLAIWTLQFTWVLHTIGIAIRIYLQGRPPVTNLYSSAIFIGWASVLLALILERRYKNTLGIAVASIIGCVTLIIAHHLSLSGDTLEMMRAVLNSNFWLSTHVVAITLGYCAMFLAGTLALLHTIRLYLSSGYIQSQLPKQLASMTYATICFALLFSFVGTLLGGVWADQSWGRFWGWDPKENGALLIVITCTFMLHARMAKVIQCRGWMALCLFGSGVTAWSWFGTNMLGVGLHSYGFIDRAFLPLLGFEGLQALLILLLMLKRPACSA